MADRERSARTGPERHLTKPATLEAMAAALALAQAAWGGGTGSSAATTPA